jgi:phosphate-selective porin OprO and OprP
MNCVKALGVLMLAAGSSANATSAGGQAGESTVSYGQKGMQYLSTDGNNFLWFGVRLQTRYRYTSIRRDDLPGQSSITDSKLELRRGRLKLGGHLATPKFTVYTEYDFTKDALLDLRASYAFNDWLNIRVGQWKSNFNRERIDSSGAQQFVDRSIATPWFTIDRQKGVMAYGRFGKRKAYDSSYWVARLSATGRGGDLSNADGFWMARYQWNFSGRDMGFGQSDIGRRKLPAGAVAFAFVDGESEFTRFSGSGGGQLPGYSGGVPGQYGIRQLLFETAWQGNGFSWQQELHWKKITDRVNANERTLVGGYAQAGMFFSEIWPSVPEPLEFALRYGNVDPNRGVADSRMHEYTFATNWFFNGHRNKLTAAISYLTRRSAPQTDTGVRFRVQWDLSF